jgi:hypothetical protein
MAKLNGWKRIGIIASVVWILGAGAYTYDSQIDSASKIIASTHVECDSNLTSETRVTGFDECNKEASDSLGIAYKNAWIAAAILAFVPVPLGWGFTYLILFLVRWVRRGFVRSL